MKPLLPLDFSLNMKSEMSVNLTLTDNAMVAKRDATTTGTSGGGMLLSPEKGSSSAFKVVTPKHSDGTCARLPGICQYF